jgi:hypothetical protein
MTPWYSDQEIDDLCAGLNTNASKCRHLRKQGLTVTQKPNGRPLVIRAHAETVLAGVKKIQEPSEGPVQNVTNRSALIALFGNRKAMV